MDANLATLARRYHETGSPEARTAYRVALRRAGMVRVRAWCGRGYGCGYGYGCGDGCGYGYGYGDGCGNGCGNGCGDGDGDGNGNGNGYGNGNGNGDGKGKGYGNGKGYGYGDGDGYGYGDGDGYGYGDGSGEPGGIVRHTEIFDTGSPVLVRSYTSGVFVGRLKDGEAGSVAIFDWRWLRRWEGVGNEGSVYDLVKSDKAPHRAGPFMETTTVLQQADVMAISEECYERLAHG